jgi:hypothetical protein
MAAGVSNRIFLAIWFAAFLFLFKLSGVRAGEHLLS